MDIYIKQKERLDVVDKLCIKIKDISDIICEDKNIEELILYNFTKGDYKLISISNIDITNKILSYNKNVKINSIGITDTVIEYKMYKKKSKVKDALKIFAICTVLFSGAATAIMSFHNETAMPDVLKTYHEIFFGYESNNSYIVSIPYSVGIGLGIILFFGHIFGKKFSDVPSPIEVEVVTYESDQAKAEVKLLAHKKSKEQKND